MRRWLILLGIVGSICLVVWIVWDSPRPQSAPVAPPPRPLVKSVPVLKPPPAAPAPAPEPPPGDDVPVPIGLTAPPSGDPEYPMVKIERARPIIVKHDPKLWEVLRTKKHRLAYLSYARPVRDCIRSFMTRRNHPSWAFGGIARIQARVENGLISFPSVNLSDHGITGMGHRPPDRQFLSCYQRATSSLRVKCPECKEGELEFSWKLRLVNWDSPTSDGLEQRPEPEQADHQFFVESGR